MKKIDKHNFFKHTYCEFKEVSLSFFKDSPAHFKSKFNSLYHYNELGVYRYADHWGRVANCRWKLISNEDFKNQQYHLGFAEWSDFLSINDNEKAFVILVDYNEQKVIFQHKKLVKKDQFTFTALEAQKRVKQIRSLFKNKKWLTYYEDEDYICYKVVNDLITTNKSLQKIKTSLK